jgi:hypothetical protein
VRDEADYQSYAAFYSGVLKKSIPEAIYSREEAATYFVGYKEAGKRSTGSF